MSNMITINYNDDAADIAIFVLKGDVKLPTNCIVDFFTDRLQLPFCCCSSLSFMLFVGLGINRINQRIN